MLIECERPGDAKAIRTLTAEAFRSAAHAAAPVDDSGDPGEAALIDWLRASDDWIPGLSLVARDDVDRIIGHVVCTRGHIGDLPAVGLGPLSVLPERQGSGVGSALMLAVVEAADSLGEPLIALLGEPAFYRRFGFGPSRAYGVTAPEAAWGDHFQVRPLAAYDPSIKGVFAYAEPFSRL